MLHYSKWWISQTVEAVERKAQPGHKTQETRSKLRYYVAADDVTQPGAERKVSCVNTELLTLERTTSIAA